MFFFKYYIIIIIKIKNGKKKFNCMLKKMWKISW